MNQPTLPSATPKRGPSAAALWANMAVIYVVWGSTYFGIAIAIETMPAFLMAAIRFTIAGLILIAFDLLQHPEARQMPTRRQLLDSFIVGALLLGVGNGFVVFGQSLEVPSGVAAILTETTPFWFALLGWLYLRQRLPRLVVGAIAVGFAGTVLLILPAGEGANRFDPLGILMLLLAELGWAHGSIYSQRRAQLPASPLAASGIQMLAGGAVTLFVEALITGEPARFHPEAISSASIFALVYLIFFGSMLAYTVRLAAPERTADARRDARLRQPGGRRRPRDAVPGRDPQCAHDHRVRDHPRGRGDHRHRPRPATGGQIR